MSPVSVSFSSPALLVKKASVAKAAQLGHHLCSVVRLTPAEAATRSNVTEASPS